MGEAKHARNFRASRRNIRLGAYCRAYGLRVAFRWTPAICQATTEVQSSQSFVPLPNDFCHFMSPSIIISSFSLAIASPRSFAVCAVATIFHRLLFNAHTEGICCAALRNGGLHTARQIPSSVLLQSYVPVPSYSTSMSCLKNSMDVLATCAVS